MMVELYGLKTDHIQHRIGESFEAEEIRDLVATFDSQADAEAYVKASELATKQWKKDFRYRRESVLRHYTDYEICSPETVSVPHNPRL
jgi:hypothetical protein